MNGSLLLLLYKRYANSTLVTMIDFKFYDQYVYTQIHPTCTSFSVRCTDIPKHGELYLKEKMKKPRNSKNNTLPLVSKDFY